MKPSIKYAAAGMMTALSVIFLAAGSILWIFAYTAPLLCGIIAVMMRRSFDAKTVWLVYFAVSVLSLVLLSDKESALIYAMFFGYYPMLREKLATGKNKALRVIIKLLSFNIAIVGAELLCTYVLMIPFDAFLGRWSAAVLLLLGNLVFIIYDHLLTMLIVIYDKKYKSRVEKLLK